MTQKPSIGAGLIAVLMITTLGGGCRVRPKYHKPSVQVDPSYKEWTPDQFKETDGWKSAV